MNAWRVDEAVVTWKILEFREFKKFYYKEWMPRKERGASIVWWINPSCEQYAISGVDNKEGKPCIQLRNLLATFNDAFLVAHEIVHVVRDLDKQSLEFTAVNDAILKKYTIKNMADFASQMGSMFDDPIVDLFLQNEYGFDPAYHYINDVIPDSLRILESSGDSIDDLFRLKNAMFYAQYSLQVEAIKNIKALREWHVLKKRYQERRPIAQKIGEDLYSMAKEIGYNTLDEQKALFNKIGDKYTLGGFKIKDILYIG